MYSHISGGLCCLKDELIIEAPFTFKTYSYMDFAKNKSHLQNLKCSFAEKLQRENFFTTDEDATLPEI
jgi:hypothetical protein